MGQCGHVLQEEPSGGFVGDGVTSRPHEPTSGLITAGYPTAPRASTAASGVSASAVLGVGIPAWLSATDVRHLSPQTSVAFALLTTVAPTASSARAAYSARA
ncbi:hypothetical protein GCM10029964_053020 [Kibdelosporangium lantanae]